MTSTQVAVAQIVITSIGMLFVAASVLVGRRAKRMPHGTIRIRTARLSGTLSIAAVLICMISLAVGLLR